MSRDLWLWECSRYSFGYSVPYQDAIIDSGCIYWQYECNRGGNCWVYDTSVLGLRGLAIALSGVFLNTILCIFCWIFYPPINCKSDTLDPKDEKASSTDDDVFSDDMEDPKRKKLKMLYSMPSPQAT